ncbi:MAG TPA: hypothetical protein VGP46_06765, partial [Acidimicrobiales bacterium]|nr:hypothetical protein [Acidimicrobiales bacterium]
MTGALEPANTAVRRAVAIALEEDLTPLGDITAALLPAGIAGQAAFVSRSDGIVAGVACVAEACRQVDAGLTLAVSRRDGDAVGAG